MYIEYESKKYCEQAKFKITYYVQKKRHCVLNYILPNRYIQRREQLQWRIYPLAESAMAPPLAKKMCF